MTALYCLGFAFFPNGDCVLIKKSKPAWQKGRWNGVGGKIEDGEDSHAAMSREFKEETGVLTDWCQWKLFTVMRFTDVRVFCFVTKLNETDKPRTTTEEEVSIVSPHERYNTLENLEWLVPMARNFLNDPESNEVPHTLDHE